MSLIFEPPMGARAAGSADNDDTPNLSEESALGEYGRRRFATRLSAHRRRQPLVRLVAAAVLEDAGFAVYEAKDAEAAIHVLETRTEIRAVVTDVNMPGTMDGLKLAHYIRGRWPPVKIIVTAALGLESSRSLPPGVHFMTKPYHPDRLTKKLTEMLAA